VGIPSASAETAPESTAWPDPLLEAALALVAAGGRRAASVRAVAGHTGVSPSAVSYRFGSKDALVAATFELARDRDRSWRTAALAGLPAGRRNPAMLAGLLHAVVHLDGAEHRALSRVRWECFLSTEFDGEHRAITAAWSADHQAFWADALGMLSLDNAGALLVAEFADALARLYLGAGSPLGYMAWTGEACARFANRLLRRDVGPRTDGTWRQAYLTSDSDLVQVSRDLEATSEVARQIIDGAVQVLTMAGPQGLTHRAVALAAGVSLSSTTYHFASRADILRAAYRRLYGAWIRRSNLASSSRASGQSPEDVIERMLAAMFPEPGVVSPEQLTQQLLQLEASRDAELYRGMDDLRAGAGPATVAQLNSIDELADTVDELDGFCFATWVTGLSRSTRLLERPEREAYMRARYRDALRLLFGV
jgi:AcrR family transcriptional regulator